MVRKCIVADCLVSERCHPEIPMFSLPSDVHRRQIWLTSLDVEEFSLTSCSRVCLLHFEDKYLIDHGHRVTLTKDAVPTVLKPAAFSEGSAEPSPATSQTHAMSSSSIFHPAVVEAQYLSQEKRTLSPCEGNSQASPAKSPVGKVASKYLRLSQEKSSQAPSSQAGSVSVSSSKYSQQSSSTDGTFNLSDNSPKRQRLEESREKENYLSADSSRIFMVSEAQLRILLRRCVSCGQPCDADCALFSLGVDIRAEQHCKDCSLQIWRSFPTTESPAIHRGNFSVTAATIFAGNTYEDLATISANLNLQMMSKSTFYRYSTVYIYDTVDEEFCEREAKLYDGIRRQQMASPTSGLRLAMDGRFSRPGFTATFGLVTALDLDRHRIIACHLRKKNDADIASSSDMETVGTRTVLNSLIHPCSNEPLALDLVTAILDGDEEEAAEAWDSAVDIDEPNSPPPIRVAAVVTDDNSAVTKMMKIHFPSVRHDGDTWHVMKAIRKRLAQLAARAATREVGYWSNAIINFLLTAIKKCGGDGELLLEQWRAVANHVFDVHKWPDDATFTRFTKCDHSDDYTPTRSLYLLKNTKAHKAILDLVNDADLQRRIYRCRYYMQTSALENFHCVLLKYLPKRLHFSDRAFSVRSKLAVMDWENNYNAGMKLNSDGNVAFSLVVPAAAQDWRIKRTPMDHSFIWSQNLMQRALDDSVEASLAGKTMADTRSIIPEKTLVSAYVRPNRLTMLERDYRRRFGALDVEGVNVDT